MGKGQHVTGSRDVRTLFTVGTVAGLTDGQLLERFTLRGGEAAEAAFAALVERHGPMVLRVCRSALREPNEVDDAFQATFLVLVRRARTLWVRDSLGPWLYQVAYRVASCARSAAVRRRKHERRAAEQSSPGTLINECDDLDAQVHYEVNRLPAGCRTAVVLCYFEGLSPNQAAQQLGCPVGTIQSRLARGRARLRTRLTRRGLAPALGALERGAAAEAATASPPAALAEATVRAAVSTSAVSAPVTTSAVVLTQGVLRSMFLIKLRAVAAALITIVALAAGAEAMLRQAQAPLPEPNLEPIRAQLGSEQPFAVTQPDATAESGPPPLNLAWNDVAPGERQQIIDHLAALSSGNFNKIKTWQGSYNYVQRQYLDNQFVAQFLAGAGLGADKSAPQFKPEPLIQEFDSVLTFAADVGSDSMYRDIETHRMRFLRIGTDEEVRIPNVGPADGRSILTPNAYLIFNPKERATSAFLPDHPEAQQKRRVERFPVQEARMREGGKSDPRSFFKFDPVNFFWSGLELYIRAFRGDLGAEPKKLVEERLKISQADGPGGRWYRDQMGFTAPNQPTLWVTTLWSPLAGYNPVQIVKSFDTPDGKLQSTIEWHWKVIDNVYMPSTIKESNFPPTGGPPSKEQVSKLKNCVLNAPLDPHQFDEQGLGAADGDLVLNHLERVAYIIRGGKPVKLASFGEGSILHPAQAKPEQAKRTPTKPSAEAKLGDRARGRIFTTASLSTADDGRPISSVVAVDPESGAVTKIFDNSPGRLRVSPDGHNFAFVSGEWWSNLPPPERMRKSLWIRPLAAEASPQRVARLDGDASTGGDLPVWSSDGKQIIVTLGNYDDSRKRWVNETFRISADGSNKEPLKIPQEDSVQDWSPDGAWIITASSRNAKIGWQLHVMRPDGKDEHRITEGGNPFFARFSPDGRRVLYTDGPARERHGIWTVDLDGKNRRKILPTGKGTASACWSPDGQRIAVAISGSTGDEHGRLEIVNPDGTHRTLLTLPTQRITDMPDWR
jgi:RNA polymerase sigma factor (sigma-70 family)